MAVPKTVTGIPYNDFREKQYHHISGADTSTTTTRALRFRRNPGQVYPTEGSGQREGRGVLDRRDMLDLMHGRSGMSIIP